MDLIILNVPLYNTNSLDKIILIFYFVVVSCVIHFLNSPGGWRHRQNITSIQTFEPHKWKKWHLFDKLNLHLFNILSHYFDTFLDSHVDSWRFSWISLSFSTQGSNLTFTSYFCFFKFMSMFHSWISLIFIAFWC